MYDLMVLLDAPLNYLILDINVLGSIVNKALMAKKAWNWNQIRRQDFSRN